MILGFQSRYVESVCDGDGRNWKLLTPVVYMANSGTVYVIPQGASTDGASTPAILFSILPPFGAYWQSAVLHDSAYNDSLRIWAGAPMTAPLNLQAQFPFSLPKASLSKDDCDALLKEAMLLSGVDEVTAETIFEGVQLGGNSAFKQDRS